MSLRVLICAVLISAAPALAAPFVPESDSQLLERLPVTPSDAAVRDLRLLQSRLIREPGNLSLAVRLARGYLELGRATGDPRYAGYAEAALAPWWHLDRAPQEVLVLRAALRQRMHQFDTALTDLAIVLDANPRNAQARLMRATLLQVQGAYEGARAECLALQNLTRELVQTACLTSVNAATGQLRESYEQLRAALGRHPNAQPELKVWLLTSLGEMAARAGMAQEAEAQFRAALALADTDSHLLGAYADFLLDTNRSSDVVTLLRDKSRVDPLLLRYALALHAQHSNELQARVEQLRERFAASRLRGDRVHLREEARFTLYLLNDPQAALRLAQDNWQLQKEPADARILLEAALAASDVTAVDAVADWLRGSGLEDVQLSRLVPNTKHPTNGKDASEVRSNPGD
jgi:tetratricopeptide (TPR) repeat protein